MTKEERRILSELSYAYGNLAHKSEDYSVAEHYYKNSIIVAPDNYAFQYSLVYPLALQKKFKEAIAQCTLVALNSEEHRNNALYTRSLLRLNAGDYINGFKDFEIRLKQQQQAPINSKFKHKPYWEGQPCKSIYIYGEQGFGDILMFGRFVPLIKTKFKVDKIYYEVSKSINGFFKYNFRNDKDIQVISDVTDLNSLGGNEAFKSSEYYIHVGSLAKLFETTVDNVPQVKWEAEPEYIEKYKKYKGSIGVCCGGRRGDDFGAVEWNSRRNVDKDITYSIIGPNKAVVKLEKEENPEIKLWSDTAGIIANCKYIISIDSGPFHMAASMGVPVILLNHGQKCWRHYNGNPWYKDNVKQIEQIKDRDWSNVYDELKIEIANRG